MEKFILWRKIIISSLFLVVSLTANYYASMFAVEKASNPVEDLILSNIPTFDVAELFVIGPMVFWLFMAYILFRTPYKIPFALNTIALFTLIRSGFVTLTHIGISPGHIIIPHDFLGFFPTGADLFFSGHTALPFLMALIFWDRQWLRLFCIAASIFFGVVVLLGHVHYSIDVASAYFITFSIYHIAIRFFKRDLAVFKNGIQAALVAIKN